MNVYMTSSPGEAPIFDTRGLRWFKWSTVCRLLALNAFFVATWYFGDWLEATTISVRDLLYFLLALWLVGPPPWKWDSWNKTRESP